MEYSNSLIPERKEPSYSGQSENDQINENLQADSDYYHFDDPGAYYYPYDPVKKNQPHPASGDALASLVLGIFSILTALIPVLSLIFSISGIALFCTVASKCSSLNIDRPGTAIGGLLCSVIGMIIHIPFCLFLFAVFAHLV